MTRPLKFALAVTSLLIAGSVNALVIDAFDDTQMLLQASSTANQSASSSSVANAIGNARKFTMTQVSGATLARIAAAVIYEEDPAAPKGHWPILSVSNPDRVNSTITVIWDGTSADPYTVSVGGLNHANLMVQNDIGFLLKIPSIDTEVTLALTVWDSDSNASFSYKFPKPGQQFIPYTEFAGVDFSDVGAIRLVMSGVIAWDGSIDILETKPNPAPVPGTALLLGVGLLGLARRARRAGSPD
jgi:hypothetical protein